MLGRLKPVKHKLSPESRSALGRNYCGLCCGLRSEYGRISTLSLTHDLSFVAGIFEALGAPQATSEESLVGCTALPWRRVAISQDGTLTRILVHLNLLLLQAKLKDDLDDDNSLVARTLLHTSQGAFRQAASALTELQFPVSAVENLARDQSQAEGQWIEEDLISGLNDCAEPSARLSRTIFEWIGEYRDFPKVKLQDVANFGDSLGRAIYLADCFEDLEEDRLRGRFNPLHKLVDHEKTELVEFAALVRNDLWNRWQKLAEHAFASQQADLREGLSACLEGLSGQLHPPPSLTTRVPFPHPVKTIRRRKKLAAYYRGSLCFDLLWELGDWCCWQNQVKQRENQLAAERAEEANRKRPPSIVEQPKQVTPFSPPPPLREDLPPLFNGVAKCPGCSKSSMGRHALGQGGLFHCSDCGGVWLDPEHLDEIKRDPQHADFIVFPRNAKPASIPQGQRCCPVDGETLDLVRRKGVTVDECPACEGWFLDPGELGTLVNLS